MSTVFTFIGIVLISTILMLIPIIYGVMAEHYDYITNENKSLMTFLTIAVFTEWVGLIMLLSRIIL